MQLASDLEKLKMQLESTANADVAHSANKRVPASKLALLESPEDDKLEYQIRNRRRREIDFLEILKRFYR